MENDNFTDSPPPHSAISRKKLLETKHNQWSPFLFTLKTESKGGDTMFETFIKKGDKSQKVSETMLKLIQF